MDIKKLIDTLHPLERKVLPVLAKILDFDEILKKTGLKDVEVMRALQWLENKQVVKLKDQLKEVIELGKNGKKYLEHGLPEKRFLKEIKDGQKDSETIKTNAGLSKEEFGVCLGVLKKNSAVLIEKKEGKLIFKITPTGKKFLERTDEENLLKKLPVELKSLNDSEKMIFEGFKRRKDIVNLNLQKIKNIELTDLGKKLIKEKISDEEILDRLTPEMLKTGAWKGKKFRRYDIEINVPEICSGKKQHYRRFLEQVRQKFFHLGFTECDGPVVECDFYNMDALYMPQFHSARDIHDAYYIKEPKYCKLDEALVKKVKAAHEGGYGTGSKGWRYKFDIKKTHTNLLRTHDTAISARTLSSKKLKIPGKYFQISRCFRPDVIDASHNVDFNQIGGFVIGENLNLRHLFGLLAMFAKEFAGAAEYRIVPGYFPFTEPSAELLAKHPDLGWIELAGSGMFRPEMVKPLVGRVVPVVAWGVGIDRLAMFKLGLNDIRQLFSHDLSQLRNMKVI
jgi:phenylalanyl-tRNA synthetase alpha chain